MSIQERVLYQSFTRLLFPKGILSKGNRQTVKRQAGRTGGMPSESRRYGLACVGVACHTNHSPPLSNRGHKLSGNSSVNMEKAAKTVDF